MTLNRWLLLITVLIGSALGILVFGDPQWNRWVYMFQLKLQNREQDSYLSPPNDYSGTWHDWNSDGQLILEQEIEKGEAISVKEYEYSSNGELTNWHVSMFKKFSGTETKWIYNSDSKLIAIQAYIENNAQIKSLSHAVGVRNVVVFDIKSGVDRRKEFGIPVE